MGEYQILAFLAGLVIGVGTTGMIVMFVSAGKEQKDD